MSCTVIDKVHHPKSCFPKKKGTANDDMHRHAQLPQVFTRLIHLVRKMGKYGPRSPAGHCWSSFCFKFWVSIDCLSPAPLQASTQWSSAKKPNPPPPPRAKDRSLKKDPALWLGTPWIPWIPGCLVTCINFQNTARLQLVGSTRSLLRNHCDMWHVVAA